MEPEGRHGGPRNKLRHEGLNSNNPAHQIVEMDNDIDNDNNNNNNDDDGDNGTEIYDKAKPKDTEA